jgi:glutaredoxin-like protein
MALLSPRDENTVRTRLADLGHRVTLLFFTQTIGAPETVRVAKRVLSELVELSPLVQLEEVNLILDRERAAQYGVEHVPAVVLLRDGADTRIRFLGAPAGYEFMSLVDAVALAGASDSGLQESSKALIAERVTAPLDIKVFVTPTCPYCPRAVTMAHRMAVEHPLITATCVEATEFPELTRRYHVTGVPKTVAGTAEVMGALPEDQFVEGLLPPTPGSAGAPPPS